jgi:hypothetical protein
VNVFEENKNSFFSHKKNIRTFQTGGGNDELKADGGKFI